MLNATVQKLGDATILHFKGRIVIGDACLILRNAVLGQADSRMLVLDLAQVDRIDAGGLGVLLGLREWARSKAIMFKLMNAGNKVEQVLELTRLDRVFESCSVRDLFCLCAVQQPCRHGRLMTQIQRMQRPTATLQY